MKTVKLLANGTEYNLTDYVTFPITYNDDISKVLDTANLSLPITPTSLNPSNYPTDTTPLDLTNPIKPLSVIVYADGGQVKKYYVREDESEFIYGGGNYKHDIALIELTKLLERRPIPDMTITQPKTGLGFAFSLLDTTTTQLPPSTETTLTLQNTTTVNEPSIIDGITLKEAGRLYTIVARFDIQITTTDQAQDFVLKIVAGTETHTLPISYYVGLDPNNFVGIITLNHTTLAINETVSVKILTDELSNVLNKCDVTITSKLEVGEQSLTYMDDIIDKMFISADLYDMNDTSYTPEFTLNQETRDFISNTLAPELTFSKYTLWDGLEELGDLQEAIPRIQDTTKEVAFDFVNLLNKTQYTNPYEIKQVKQLNLEKYSNAVEINADNVIESVERQNVIVEPYKNGWMSLRSVSDGPNQLTDTTVALKLRYKQYRNKQVLAKGFTVKFADLTVDTTTAWDISEYIVEQKRWNALPNLAFESVRSTVNLGKGNTLYYKDDRIFNFGYRSPKVSSLSPNLAQAIYQIIFAVAEQTTGKVVSEVNGSVNGQSFDDLLDSLYRVYHVVNTSVRARLFKHDARDFEENSTLYSNERAKLNDSIKLGQQAQSLVNRNGNRITRVSGIASELVNVPKIGNLVGIQIFTQVNVTVENGYYVWEGWLFDNYTEISSFVGIDSAYRQYEVPNEDVVERKLLYVEPITISRTLGTPTHSILTSAGLSNLTLPFANLTPSDMTYHVASYRHSVKVPTDVDWDSSFDVNAEGPIDIKAEGMTTVIEVTNKDNYSVDDLVEQFETDLTVPKRYQNNYRYSNIFGKVDSIRYEFYEDGFVDNVTTDAELYPTRVSTTSSNKLIGLDVRALKDARERISFAINIPFFSRVNTTEDLRVYYGTAKYNGFALQDSNADLAVVFWEGEFPTQEKIKIEPNTYVEAPGFTVNGTTFTNYIRLQYAIDGDIGEVRDFDGWGLINKTTQELIYFAKVDLTSGPVTINDTIYVYADKTKGQ